MTMGVFLPAFWNSLARVYFDAGSSPMVPVASTSLTAGYEAPRVYDPLWGAFTVEVADLFEKLIIFQRRRATVAHRARGLVIGDGMALARGQGNVLGRFFGFVFLWTVAGSSVKPNCDSVGFATAFFYLARIRPLDHPPAANITLVRLLHALADPVRLAFVRVLVTEQGGINCVDTMTKAGLAMPKSTCSAHFQILRKAGVVFSQRRGIELINYLRRDDLQARFPGLLTTIIEADQPAGARNHSPSFQTKRELPNEGEGDPGAI